MQVSGSYSAIGALTRIDPTQQPRRESRRSAARAGDTVSISEEALAAFRNSALQGGEALEDERQDTATKFRQALEEAWNETESAEPSLREQLRGLWNKLLD